MKTFREFILIAEQVKDYKTPQELADKHKVSLEYIESQIKIGSKIELEHTKDKKLAKIIASQHLDERPDYYKLLVKMEKTKVSEGTLHHWFTASKSKNGKPGWVQPDGSPCANEPGETKTPKCFSSARLNALKKKGKVGRNIIKSAVRRKREQDPNQQDKSGSAKPTMVKTFSGGKKHKHYIKAEPTLKEATKDIPKEGSGTKDACYYKVKSRFKVWPSAYACVPIETSKALTKNGWKYYSELSIGEEILTYSLEKDILEFNPILNLFHYKNAPTYVVQNGNTGWRVECTPNHKWVIKYPKCKENRKRRKYTDLINDMNLVSMEELLHESGSNRRLVISSQYNGSKSFENFKLIDKREKDVWCPQTKNGTWVMMQETDGKGIITITGNSGALVKCRTVGADNWGNKSKKLNESYTRLQKTGNMFSIVLTWKGVHRIVQFFVPGFNRPTRDQITQEVNKIYPGAKVLNYRPSLKDPTKPFFIFGDI